MAAIAVAARAIAGVALKCLPLPGSGSGGSVPAAAGAILVGGGIGGLATAYALARKGIPVRLLEQVGELACVGRPDRRAECPRGGYRCGCAGLRPWFSGLRGL